MSAQKRIMVDMSATLIHHGHVRLLKQAKQLGYVVVALTTDEEIRSKKGYQPELDYAARAEVLLAMRDVDEVVPSPWLLDAAFLQ
jgi:glycerol-3-phosphate cytidylyltransferase